MPYSRGKEKRLAKLVKWPDLRYNPVTGEAKLFHEAKDVPLGWLTKRPKITIPRVGVVLDREQLVRELTDLGIEINPTWGTAHMKRILDDRSSAR
jgi:hypothetical protein